MTSKNSALTSGAMSTLAALIVAALLVFASTSHASAQTAFDGVPATMATTSNGGKAKITNDVLTSTLELQGNKARAEATIAPKDGAKGDIIFVNFVLGADTTVLFTAGQNGSAIAAEIEPSSFFWINGFKLKTLSDGARLIYAGREYREGNFIPLSALPDFTLFVNPFPSEGGVTGAEVRTGRAAEATLIVKSVVLAKSGLDR